jgi:SAM-dependent methyltransferase
VDLRSLASSVPTVQGWDFSYVQAEIDPIPWEYTEVARRYLKPGDHVLDIGTAGGEIFMRLAEWFGTGIGIDVDDERLAKARATLPPEMEGRVQFERMAAQHLDFPPESFDVALNRHAPVFSTQIVPLLKPDGLFICQQVGPNNTRNIFELFGWPSSGEYWRTYWDQHHFPHQDVPALIDQFRELSCSVVAHGSYDVRYYFRNVESLLFHMKAVPLPVSFDVEEHAPLVEHFIQENTRARGIETNEHRDLLVVRKG